MTHRVQPGNLDRGFDLSLARYLNQAHLTISAIERKSKRALGWARSWKIKKATATDPAAAGC